MHLLNHEGRIKEVVKKLSNKLLYDESKEFPFSDRFLYMLSILVGIVFIYLGLFSTIHNSPLYSDLWFKISAIIIGIIWIIISIIRIITWQNFRIDEKGIFPSERSIHEGLNKKERYISFEEIINIIDIDGRFSMGKIIIKLNNGRTIEINKGTAHNLKKILHILNEKKGIVNKKLP